MHSGLSWHVAGQRVTACEVVPLTWMCAWCGPVGGPGVCLPRSMNCPVGLWVYVSGEALLMDAFVCGRLRASHRGVA
jgi:hypothetical protein